MEDTAVVGGVEEVGLGIIISGASAPAFTSAPEAWAYGAYAFGLQEVTLTLTLT